MNKTSFKSKKWTKILSTLLLGSVLLSSCDCFNESEKNPQENNSQGNTSQGNTSQGNTSQGNNSQENEITTSTETDYIIKTENVTVNKAGDVSSTYLYVIEKTTTITKQNSEIIKSTPSYNDIKVDVSFNKETNEVEIKTDIEKLKTLFENMYDDIVTNNYEPVTPVCQQINGVDVTGDIVVIEDVSAIKVTGSDTKFKGEIALQPKEGTGTEASLLEVSDVAKAFPNATITADDKVSYTIKGGKERDEDPTHAAESYNTLLDNEFKDLTTFKIDGKISIVDSTDDNTHEVYEPTKIRTITVGDNTTLNITGKYLDIGRNRFKRDLSSDAIINLPDDIEITTYNSEVMDASRTYITSDIAKEQFDALGLTTPNFDLAISDENLYNFAHDILDRYDAFNRPDTTDNHKLETSTEYIDGTVAGNLYDGDTLRDKAPSVKFSSIELCTTLIVGNTKITGTKNVSRETLSIDFSNVVFTEDASGMHTTGSFYGISHFMGNPMQGVSNSNGYVKVDYVDTNVGEIFGDIIDLTNLSDDIMYDIGSNRNMILGIGADDVIGIFRDEKQQVAAENIRKKGSNIDFNPVYLQNNPEHKKEFIKTLADWEVEYNSSKKLQSSNTAQLDAKLQNKNSEKDKVLYALLKKREYNA